MPTLRSERTEPLTLTADSLNTGVTFAVDFAGDDGVPFVGATAPTKTGTLPVVGTAVGPGRDISNGGASGINQYRWTDATKIGVPAGVAAFTMWVRLRTPTMANSGVMQREVVRLTNGSTTKLSISQYELNTSFSGYAVHIVRDGATNLIDYSTAGAIIQQDTVYDIHLSRDAAGAYKIYVNGVLRKSGTGFVSDFTVAASSSVTFFGGVNFGTRNGVLIDAITWDRQLSDSEVTAHQADPYSYQVSSSVVETLTLDSPADGATVGSNIVISGTSNTTGSIEARFNGGSWQTIVAGHSGSGTYSGTLTGQSTGTGTLEVRIVGKAVTDSAANITVASASVSIASPVARQAYQHTSGFATIPVTVTHVLPTANLEARFNGGAWQTFAVGASPQTLNLTGCPIGEGVLEVRFKESAGISAAVNNVAVGNVFLVIGQSNASGHGSQNNSYTTSAAFPAFTAHLFKNATATALGEWADLVDPTDAGGAGESSSTQDTTAAGSAWPLLATKILDAGVPVAFIPATKGGVGIVNYAKTNGLDTTTAYGYAVSRALSCGARYALYYQGESDAMSGNANYEAQLNTLVNNLWNDCGLETVVGKTHYWTGQSTSSVDAIRTAQQAVIDNNVHAIQGPDLLGANTGGDIHFLATSEMQTVADRWFSSLTSAGIVGAGTTAPSGVVAAASVGTATASEGAVQIAGNATPAGVSAAATVTGPMVTGAALVLVAGVRATASAGTVTVSSGTLATAPAGSGYSPQTKVNQSRPAATQRNYR